MSPLKQRLAAKDVVLIDGATGTELERNGVPMLQGAWCGGSALTHPGHLRRVHESNIKAGAQVIAANTYASSRHVLEQAGLEDQFEELNRVGIEIALAARDGLSADHVTVAGSISTTEQGGEFPTLDVARVNFYDQARIQADAGAEIFLLEMMREIPQTLVALEAALSTGLPVWMGLSCIIKEGTPYLCLGNDLLVDALDALAGQPIDVMSIMHTEVADVDACLDVLQAKWDGPIGVYAQTGEWAHPNWKFIDVVSPEDYTTACLGWVERGVQVIGGCCGIGPEHIDHLRTRLPTAISE